MACVAGNLKLQKVVLQVAERLSVMQSCHDRLHHDLLVLNVWVPVRL